MQMRGMVPTSWRERVETSLSLNEREGPRNLTVVFNVLYMLVGVKFLHLKLAKWIPRAEVEVAPFVMRWIIRKTKAALGADDHHIHWYTLCLIGGPVQDGDYEHHVTWAHGWERYISGRVRKEYKRS